MDNTVKEVRVGKIDLDTCGGAWLLGVTRKDQVEVLRSDASLKDIADPDVICIEVGGSGQTQLNNWDHHETGGPIKSATFQIFKNSEAVQLGFDPGPGVTMIVKYIDLLDTQGPQALTMVSGGDVEFPTLSDVFAGMLLMERDPVEQLHKGIKILNKVAESRQNPFGTIQGFESYAEAKAENNRQIAKAVKQTSWTTTKAGHKLGYLETEFFGTPGALYGVGANIAVAFNPNFGSPPMRKFTVAGNDIKVDAALAELNALENGWGGPATGTILGSPRSGSKLTLNQVVEIVKRTC